MKKFHNMRLFWMIAMMKRIKKMIKKTIMLI